MTYHKEGSACGKISYDLTSSEADCECPLYCAGRLVKQAHT